MTFTRPKIGPKVYLSRGPSGHSETFDRASADRELALYLGSEAKMKIAIEGYIRKLKLDRKVEDWSDIQDYLAEMTGLDVDHIPLNVAISFWAQVALARDAAKAAQKLVTEGN